jgi:hypothetical protein
MGVFIKDIGPPDTIAPGATLFTEYWFGDFWDVGMCVAAVASVPRFEGHLEVTRQGRIRWLKSGGLFPGANSYTVTITNKGTQTVAYNLSVAMLSYSQ